MSKIMILGDVHGSWGELNTIINKKHPDLVLQCGDFGFFPHEKAKPQPTEHGGIRRGTKPKTEHPYDPAGQLKNHGTPIHWCDGNHEDHEELRRIASGKLDPVEIAPNVYYQPRGSTLTLPDGRVVLFMGGAASYDKAERDDWSALELLTIEDLARLPEGQVDIVVSHTCPAKFDLSRYKVGLLGDEQKGVKFDDPSRLVLDEVLDHYRPKLWYFGHWHSCLEGEVDGCRWRMLNMTPRNGCWTWLEDYR